MDELDENLETIRVAIQELQELKEVQKVTKAAIDDITASLVNLLESEYGGGTAIDEETEVYVIRATRTSWSDDVLRDNLSQKEWYRISTRVLDETKIEDAIANSEISLELVADALNVKDSKPYIKVGKIKNNDAVVSDD